MLGVLFSLGQSVAYVLWSVVFIENIISNFIGILFE